MTEFLVCCWILVLLLAIEAAKVLALARIVIGLVCIHYTRLQFLTCSRFGRRVIPCHPSAGPAQTSRNSPETIENAPMRLELHEECQKRLAEQLSAALRSIRVSHGRFLDYSTTASLLQIESSLPGGKLRERASLYVGELPFSDFVGGALAMELYKTQKYREQETPVALTEIDGYRDVAAVAANLLNPA